MRKIIMTVTALILILAIVSGACAKPAPAPTPAPAPAPAPKPTPTPAPASKPTPAPAPKADPLAEIIEGAKKEGVVTMTLLTNYTPPEVVQLLIKNIRDKYGVELDIKVTGQQKRMGSLLADALLEHQTGAVPTYDLNTFQANYIAQGMKAGVFEKVDWKPILEEGTPSEILPVRPILRGAIAYNSSSNGLMYNPETVSAAETPRSISDLADPKWKGRLGIFSYASHWTRWAFILGKDNTLSYLRSIMKNKPLVGGFAPLNRRYLLGEIDLAFTSSVNLVTNRKKGMPTEYHPIQFLDGRDQFLILRKGALHPNAAKLVAVYLSSRDGVKFSVEHAGAGHFYYPGNHVYDIVQDAKKQGIPVQTIANYPGLLEFIASDGYNEWQKEIKLILQGG